MMLAVGGGSPCNPGTAAFTVETGVLPGTGPHHHVYLCPSLGNAAGAMGLPLSRIHDGWRFMKWDDVDYDQFMGYMSQVLTHEFSHIIDNTIIDHGMPGYTFAGIQTLTPQQKNTNAHSFSYSVVGLWLRHNTMGSQGVKVGKMSRKFSRNNRPGIGPHYDQNP
jgi:hypothetical protein